MLVAVEVFSDVSSELSRRLLGELNQIFYDASRNFTKQVTSKINEYVEEFADEYKKYLNINSKIMKKIKRMILKIL